MLRTGFGCGFFALAILAGIPMSAAPVIGLDSGRIGGVAAGDIVIFRGIPYAAPPVKALRWRPPQKVAAWSDVRDATAFGPACPQAGAEGVTDITRYGGAPEPTSEDCLTLNVWAPEHAKRAAVMVWIHGGSGRMGAGSLPYYDGTAFARDGVVLVTINYRLGHLGAFAYPGLSQEGKALGGAGNYAMMDQIAALKWVKHNIAAFGGDPANVTIFGESSGGISVLSLATSPAARGMFAKAIVESGGGWYPPPVGLEDAEKQGKEFAAAIGAPANATLDQLRAIPARTIAAAKAPTTPAPDAKLLPESPTTAIDGGRHAYVPLLIGVNNGEDSLLNYGGGMKKALAGLKPDQLEKMRKVYGPELTAEEAIRHQLADGLAAAPARWVATRWSKNAPVYLYRFEHGDEWRMPERTRAAHGGEVFYVFKTLDKKLDDPPAPTPGDEKLAGEVHARWVAFAKTGSPNGPSQVTWPAYSTESDPWLVFGQKNTTVQHHVLKPQLDYFEGEIAPLIWLFRVKSWWSRTFG